jgi:hypothetical protein
MFNIDFAELRIAPSALALRATADTSANRLRTRRLRACLRDLAASFTRGFVRCVALHERGRREDRVLPAPAVPRAVCARAKAAHEHTGTGGASRPSLRNGLTAYLVLSPENGSFASVISETLSPLADLMPAPRHQDHTTSPYASGAHVCRAIGVHRIPPRVRDVRERPSHRVRRAELCG